MANLPSINVNMDSTTKLVDWENHFENDEDTKIVSIQPIRIHLAKKVAFICASAIFAFIPLLFVKWYLKMRKALFYTDCTAENATHFLIKGVEDIVEIVTITEVVMGKEKMKVFKFRFMSYHWDGNKNKYLPTKFPYGEKNKVFREKYQNGFTNYEVKGIASEIYGKCQIIVPVKNCGEILLDELLTPFYLFQIFSVILWMCEEYYYYSAVIFLLATGSLIYEVIEKRHNLINVSNMAKLTVDIKTKKVNSEEFVLTSSENLVPGDVIELDTSTSKKLITIPCDAVMLSGSALINESMLTGESTPMCKTALPEDDEIYDPEKTKKYTLYSGTKVLKAKAAKAVVIRTGYLTSKGALVRSIMYPRANTFNFYADSMKYVAIMAGLAVIGFCITINSLMAMNYKPNEIVTKLFDLITISVPPALPTALSIGTSFAISRLKKCQIFCISPLRINVAGKISKVVFDKTGTLTEDGLKLHEVWFSNKHPLSDEKEFEKPISTYEDMKKTLENNENGMHGELCMALCHALDQIDENGSMVSVGDPLEVEMFKVTQWVYHETPDTKIKAFSVTSHDNKYNYDCLKTFDFVNKLARMSVLSRNTADNKLYGYSKGSPEKIKELSIPSSIPGNYAEVQSELSKHGLRVISLAYKPLQESDINIDRDNIEKDLIFLGFLVLENKLKEATNRALTELSNANIQSIMATGDNIDTAISIGKKCGILSDKDRLVKCELIDSKDPANPPRLRWVDVSWVENVPKFSFTSVKLQQINLNEEDSDSCFIAITGAAYEHVMQNQKELLPRLIKKGKIYARMPPEGKASLVEELQKLTKEMIGMCGDGANDCDALKAADVGLSLSEAEASIAAPFTSKILDVSSYPKLLKEGRCALTTSVQCFKFMALYSIIQFTCITLLYKLYTNLSDLMFLYQDLFIIIPLAATMSWSKPNHILGTKLPESKLVGLNVLLSVLPQICLQIVFQICVVFILLNQPYTTTSHFSRAPAFADYNGGVNTMETTTLFVFSNMQYIATCFTFTMGKPFREPVYKNIAFIVNIILIVALNVYINIYPAKWLQRILEV